MVFQNVYLFHDSIENNIKFGKPDATHEEVEAAAKRACCHDFISALPDGYNTIIGEGGSTLSGGEKQRISIARAILKDAPIIILDEATSSVDPENEQALLSAISELTKNKTLISIAHRLSTVENADQIIVIDAAHGLIDGPDYRGTGVVRVEGGTSGGSIFLRGQQLFQLGIFRSPCGLLRVKGVGQTAPAHIPGKNFLLLRRCLFSGFLQIFQQLDCRDIGLKLGFRTAFTQVVVGDTEILSGAAQIGLVFLIGGFFGSSGIGGTGTQSP